MPTNDEIREKKLAIVRAIKSNYIRSEDSGAWIISLIDEIEDLARSDTAKQIFKELDDILMDYFVDAKLEWEIYYGYTALKKKYKVD